MLPLSWIFQTTRQRNLPCWHLRSRDYSFDLEYDALYIRYADSVGNDDIFRCQLCADVAAIVDVDDVP